MSEGKQLEVVIKERDEKLYGLKWEIENPKANIIIMEGMEEHSSRYDYFAKQLNSAGFSAYCLDTYGQGQNVCDDESKVGIWPVDGFIKQVDNNGVLAKMISKNKIPTYVFAHSMGSYMLQSFLQRWPNAAEKVILCGSGAKNSAVGMGMTLAKMIVNEKNRDQKAKTLNNLMFGNFNKKIKRPKTRFDWLSYNEENVNRYIADPLCGFSPTNGFCFEFLKGMTTLYTKENLANINKNTKIFIISGDEDPVTSYGKSVETLRKMYSACGVNFIDTKIYKKMRHEILNEDLRDDVIADIINFFVNA